MYYLISVTSEEGVMTPYNFTTSMITVDGTMYSINVSSSSSIEVNNGSLNVLLIYTVLCVTGATVGIKRVL